MKKLLSLLLVLLVTLSLAACTPDENTATEMEQWKAECEAIPTCSDWLTSEFEERLTESEYIAIVEARLDSLEGRVDKIESILFAFLEEEIVSAEKTLSLLNVQRDNSLDVYVVSFTVDLELLEVAHLDIYDYEPDYQRVITWMNDRGLTYLSIGIVYNFTIGEEVYVSDTFTEDGIEIIVSIENPEE